MVAFCNLSLLIVHVPVYVLFIFCIPFRIWCVVFCYLYYIGVYLYSQALFRKKIVFLKYKKHPLSQMPFVEKIAWRYRLEAPIFDFKILISTVWGLLALPVMLTCKIGVAPEVFSV